MKKTAPKFVRDGMPTAALDLQEAAAAPQPDSVEAARQLAMTLNNSESASLRVLTQLRDFLYDYAAEQTRQRKAAGELAKLLYDNAANGTRSFSSTWRTLAADAETRAGGAK